jgi:hypothetical protein
MFSDSTTTNVRSIRANALRWSTQTLALALVVGAVLFASGIASPVHARMSWLGLLPLLIAVRLMRPVWAGTGGAIWGFSVWCFATTLFSADVPFTWSACLRFVGIGGGFGLIGAATTQRFGFHPFLLSAAWLVLDLALHADAGTLESGGLSYYLSRVLGTACLGSILIFCNAALVWAVLKLAKCADGVYAWLRRPRVARVNAFCESVVEQQVTGFWGYPRAPPAA